MAVRCAAFTIRSQHSVRHKRPVRRLVLGTSMRKLSLLPLLIFIVLSAPAVADPLNTPRDAQIVRTPRYIAPPSIDERAQPRERSDFADNRPRAARPGSMGGGFIEFLFTGRSELPRSQYQRPWEDMAGGADGPHPDVC